MPERFTKCVEAVKKNIAKTGYKGNPYAICRKSTGFYGSTKEKRR